MTLYAEQDNVVLPEANTKALEAALAQAGNPDATINKISGVKHLFLTTSSSDPVDWAALPGGLPTTLLETISTWLASRREDSRHDGSGPPAALMPRMRKTDAPC